MTKNMELRVSSNCYDHFNNTMTDKTKYRNVSLSHYSWSRLHRLSKTLLPGTQLSISKTVECLVSDRLANPHKQGTKNDRSR